MDGAGGIGVRVVGASVDSLYLAYRFRASGRQATHLEDLKAQAAASRRVTRDPRTGEPLEEDAPPAVAMLGGESWTVRPYGSASGPLLGWNDAFGQWAFNPRPLGSLAPRLQVKLFAAALWREPTRDLVALADRVAVELSELGDIETRHVQRVDIAVDFQGWIPAVADFDKFCRPGGPVAEAYPDGEPLDELLESPRMWLRWRLLGFRFGKSSTVVRLYDKTEEILVSDKAWMRDVWKRAAGYVDGEPVWRLEVQAPREWLKTLRNAGGEPLETVEQVLAHLTPVWRTVLEDRVRLTRGDASRLTRSTTHPAWKALAETCEIDGACDGEKVTRLVQDKITAEQLVPKARGYVAKYGALIGARGLDDSILALHDAVRDLCVEREETFEQLVDEKVRARRRAAEASAAADALAEVTRRRRERDWHELVLSSRRSEHRWRRRTWVSPLQMALPMAAAPNPQLSLWRE